MDLSQIGSSLAKGLSGPESKLSNLLNSIGANGNATPEQLLEAQLYGAQYTTSMSLTSNTMKQLEDCLKGILANMRT